ncbi:hypothetical protein [Kitasatospora sp. NPDC088346]|uniref:hypothetical protein n=1 Tax=Kitasatospora sp. NPDC088346 TaxID=3364073 RepID=UPI003818392E
MSDDDVEPATYQLVISVDARRSGEYDDSDKPEMRRQLYGVVQPSFAKAAVRPADLHLEDRGDGVLAAVVATVPPSALLGTWLVEAHERLRASNRRLARPLGLRVGMHIGPVRADRHGVSGRAVDLACRLADCQEARLALDAAQADLVCVVSDLLYRDVVEPGGWGIYPSAYRPARVPLKEGEVTAWFHVPDRGRPRPPAAAQPPEPAAPTPAPTPLPTPSAAPSAATPVPPPPGRAGITVGRDMHHHDRPVYTAPVHFGDTHTGPAPRREETGNE